ncbi:putative basic proline-rich protein-like isoform X2 [Iris pallida]|uniref:Basic proline-rich protein-like isoform X2 n=1 Tax=Iris pallida TaxID=29817 RepID=A0AAX6E8R4_IRIPA|nr:putative basic proline-rich protein-like isoform X2 [Iris pallida]
MRRPCAREPRSPVPCGRAALAPPANLSAARSPCAAFPDRLRERPEARRRWLPPRAAISADQRRASLARTPRFWPAPSRPTTLCRASLGNYSCVFWLIAIWRVFTVGSVVP